MRSSLSHGTRNRRPFACARDRFDGASTASAWTRRKIAAVLRDHEVGNALHLAGYAGALSGRLEPDEHSDPSRLDSDTVSPGGRFS